MSGTGSPNILACHQSLSKGSPHPHHHPGKGKAEKTSSQEHSQHLGPHLTPEYLPRSGMLVPDRGTVSGFPHTHQGCPESGSEAGSARQAPPVFLPHHEKQQCHHMKSLLEETLPPPTMPHRFGASFVNDFQSLFVYSKEMTGISSFILM